MKLFLSALCLCASGLLIYVSYKLIYAYTMIDTQDVVDCEELKNLDHVIQVRVIE